MCETKPAISVLNILSSNSVYKIPIYQRNFAWEDEHILKLIEDINDSDSGYFLGNLIVDEKGDNTFEVIDGQQRLTTLFIIGKALGSDMKIKNLDFECRERSKILLENLDNENNTEKWNQKIISGYKIAHETFQNKKKVNDSTICEKFKEKFENAQLLRISVPKGTDLNHYFEIMNTRGEQLEKIDILKSTFMETLKDKKKEQEFADIWNVCSNMNEYVIKSLFLKRSQNTLYEKYFKYEKDGFIWNDCNTLNENVTNSDDRISLSELLSPENIQKDDPTEDNQSDGHYESLVQFPEFLLHVLNIISENPDGQLNKDNILERFDFNDKKMNAEFSEKFIINLLKYRFYYDMYIGRVKAKVEEDNDDDDKENTFNMRRLKLTQDKKNTYHTDPVKTITNDKIHDNIRAIQWALRITHTSQKSMRWITYALKFINDNNNEFDENSYLTELENLIKKEVEKTGLIENNQFKPKILNNSVGTPHIIFAYLDYLLQKDNPVKSNNYYYNFRTSVEHLYPQNDNEVPDGQKLQDGEWLNNFGNLFLINRETNSKISNNRPETKWTQMAEGMTPKLEAAKIVHESSKKWADNEIFKHCEEMITVLKENL